MLRFSGSSQNPGSSVLDELQLSNGLLWKAGEETITIIHPAGDKGMNKFLQVVKWAQVRSTVLKDRILSSTDSSGSKPSLWSPASTTERSQDGTRAPIRNLMIRSCFPRDWSSTAMWCAAIVATYTFKVEGDSLRSNLLAEKKAQI